MKDTRFTIRAAGDFHHQVKERAEREGLTITAVIMRLLTAWLTGKVDLS